MSKKHVTTHYSDMYDWVKSYVESEDEAHGLTNQLHYLSIKRQRASVAAGILIGWITLGILLSWVS